MDRLAEFTTFACFSHGSDGRKKGPLALDQIRANLTGDRYTTVAAWKADVKAIWQAVAAKYEPDSLEATAGRQLRQKFVALAERISDDEVRDWWAEFEAVNRKLAELMAGRPPQLALAPRESPDSPEPDDSAEGDGSD
jgi:hypothetical protein